MKAGITVTISQAALVLAITYVSFSGVVAQNSSFRQYTREEGLSQNSVIAITQDRDGFVWLGTREGLNKFDGYEFIKYQQKGESKGLNNDDIRVLQYDSLTNSLWVGTDDGLFNYDLELDSFYRYTLEDDGGRSTIIFIYLDTKHNVWAYSSDKLYKLSRDLDTFESVQILDNHGTPMNVEVGGMQEQDGERYWLATNFGLFLVRQSSDSSLLRTDLDDHYQALEELETISVSTILRDSLGNLFMGSPDKAFYSWNFKSGTLKNFQLNNNHLPAGGAGRVQWITPVGNGDAWIGTGNGLAFFDQKLAQIRTYFGDKKVSVRSVHIDRKGSLWVGTYFDGLFYLDKAWGYFTHFLPGDSKNSLSYKVVGSMVEDKASNIWVATEGGGLNYFDPGLGQFVKVIKNRLSGNNIKSLYLDHEVLWIGTFQDGLNRFDPKSGRIDSYRFDIDDEHSLSHDNVYSITKLNGDLWVATYGGGICRSNDSGASFQRFKAAATDPTSLSSNLCRVLYCDNGNDLWIGTDQGLNLMIEENGMISFRRYLPKCKILCIIQDREERLWIGTANEGLFCLKKQMEKISIEHVAGDLGQAVFGILQDSLSNLWLGTGSGLFRFNPRNNSIISFSDAAGLEKKEFNFNSFLKSRSGRFYFGSTNGLVSFNPSEVPTGEYVAPLVFSKISGPFQKYKSDGISPRSIQYTDHISFDYNDANFTLNFALLDYANPLDHLYEYKLEGIDQNWVQARGLASATYTIQKEGDYTFYCRAANYQGIWNPTIKQLEVTVLPPFYRSPIAYLLYSLFLISAFIAVYHFIKLRKRLFLEKMTVQQQKTLHESRLQLYTDIAHEFKNPLTLIIGPLETLLSKYGTESLISKELIYAQNNAKNLLHLINQLMSFRKSEADILKMEVRLTDLVSFSKGICSRFEPEAESRSISLQFDCEKPEMHGYIDRDKMTKVLVNLLSNAFKFTPDDSRISLELSEEGDHLQWRVMDSGPGIPSNLASTIFNRFFTIPSGNEEYSIRSGSGIGLALCRKMTELHHGRIICVPNDYGAEFIISIPKGKDHFDPGDISSGQDLETGHAFYSGNIVPKNSTLISTSTEHRTRSETILIVEDNRELLTYLKDLFQDIYKVYTASNGVEGLALAEKKLPDLIISDILMDKMNGIHLCNQLKGKISTSHIPVILLTAKAAKASVLDGLSNGADDYVIKPFDPDELRMRVHNMLNHRKSLRGRLVKTFNLEPEKLELSNLDEEFVNKAIRLIESNIGNLNFTVEDFARHMMVSRQLLFSKMKSLTSMTPNNFIKMLRLKRAHQILQTSSMTISEVARKVGFRDPRYFAKCFQRQFKKLPSAVQKVE